MAEGTAPTNTDTSDFEGAQDWQEVDTEFGEKITWDEGTVFIGTFLKLRAVPMEEGKDATAAEFDVKGDKFFTWCPARLLGALNRAIEDGVLKPGKLVRIECTGTEPSKRKGLSASKTFRLSVKPS